MLKKLIPPVAAVLLLTLCAAVAAAHEHRAVHEYNFVVGFIQEPAFESLLNAVSVRITKMPEDESQGQSMHGESKEDKTDDKNDEMSMSMAGHGHDGIPVEGLESTLAVEVTHVSSGITRQMELKPVRADAGHYTAYFIPTASWQYIFRFVGSIEGQTIDETFESGPGRSADIEPATALQFPESAASAREIEAAVRGALDSAQQAQDAALNVEATASTAQGSAATATTLAIAGIVVGAVGIVVGSIGAVAAFRRKN